MKYFQLDEFTCKCGCGQALMEPRFLSRLDEARGRGSIPFVISSGYRCPDHNRAVGSTSSNHTRGVAADIRCSQGGNRVVIVQALLEAGFRRIGLHRTFVHADINDGPDSIWFYGG